jgi:hypothetical protein
MMFASTKEGFQSEILGLEKGESELRLTCLVRGLSVVAVIDNFGRK